MSSPFKRPKLAEGSGSQIPHATTSSPGSGPKVQTKISSFFQKKTTTPTPAPEPVNAVLDVLDALEGNEEELFDLTSLSASGTVPPIPTPVQLTATSTTSHSAVPATTKPSSRRAIPDSLPTPQIRVSTLDAEEQRQMDKSMKQKEKNSEKYAFLEEPLDSMRRPRSDPNYDPKTLHIPANTYYNMTDFERQYWDIKSKYFNYVVFFQKGIFYELMEADADIAAKELGLAPMFRAGMRSAGFSINEGDSQAEKLVQRGYSVVIVTQSESPIDRQPARSGLSSPTSLTANSSSSRSGSPSPNQSLFDDSSASTSEMDVDTPASSSNPKKRKSASPEPEKMLRRVVDRILTPGTCPEAAADSARAVFLLSLSMSFSSGAESSVKKACLGVCLVDTSSGTIITGELLEDDSESFTKLRTLLFHSRPREVLFTKGNLNKTVLQILKLHAGENVLLRGRSATKPLSKDGVLSQLNKFCTGSNLTNEPKAMQYARQSDLTINALGLAFEFLDETKNFDAFLRASWMTLEQYRRGHSGATMVLDSRALENLQLVEDDARQVKNSLFGLLDKTKTSFGRRMLFGWVCHPLQCPNDVERRLRNVEYLIGHSELSIGLAVMLSKLKSNDIERLIAKAISERLPLKQFVHLIECLSAISSDYQHEIKKWLDDDSIPTNLRSLLSGLDGIPNTAPLDEFGAPAEWFNRMEDYPNVDVMEDAHAELAWLRDSFDLASYHADGKLIPSSGVCPQYNEAVARLEAVNAQYRAVCNEVVQFYEQKGVFSSETSQICVNDVGNSFRLMEIPMALVTTHGAPSFLKEQKTRSTTKLARFYSVKMEQTLLPEWKEANLGTERAASLALTFLNRRVASCARLWWKPWVSTCAQLDCLVSLAKSSQLDPDRQRKPKIFSLPTDILPLSNGSVHESTIISDDSIVLEQVSKPFLTVSHSVHPLLAMNMGRSFFSSMTIGETATPATSFNSFSQVISNNITLGEVPDTLQSSEDFSEPPSSMPLSMLLTGPNMGGKSTLLRQVCIAVIMAQIGVYPFGAVAMTTCDRVFTRIGASDNIFEGRSTFMVELEEASAILNQASERSLVILDELGRGTSTFDGYSIAYATLSHLALTTRCMTLFSTHYHILTNEVQSEEVLRQLISLFYMDALVDADSHTVTFLYKMVPGTCPQSYGMMVAAMAQIPLDVVHRARAKSVEFQAAMQAKQLQDPRLKGNYLKLALLLRSLVSKRGKTETLLPAMEVS